MKTMILKIEERSIRPCKDGLLGAFQCVNFDDGYDICKLRCEEFYKREKMIIDNVEKLPRGNSELYKELVNMVSKEYPCKYNMYRNEFKELIDNWTNFLK